MEHGIPGTHNFSQVDWRSRRNRNATQQSNVHNKLCWINASSDKRNPGSSSTFGKALKTLGRRRGTLDSTHDIKTFYRLTQLRPTHCALAAPPLLV